MIHKQLMLVNYYGTKKTQMGLVFLFLLCFEIFVCCSALNIFCAGDADDKVKVCFAAFGKYSF
jgi:hypothetical protein